MDNDDKQIGTILTRREVLASMGVAGAALLAGSRHLAGLVPPGAASFEGRLPLPACVVSPAQEEGPYFVDEKLNRSDIRSDPATGVLSAGTPFTLTLRVSKVGSGGCVPAKGMLVDIWHCDADGAYSDEKDTGGRFDTSGKKFLRGYQLTDANGLAVFRTIYPGWYDGRAVHVHFKIRSTPTASSGNAFTSQLYFEDAMNERVHAALPYSKKGPGRIKNADDGIFQNGGKALTLAPVAKGKGFAATFDVGMA